MIIDAALDALLSYLRTNTTRICFCSQDPATYTEATDTYLLGHKDTPTINVPEARTPSGRKIVAAAITDGTVDTAGTATHYALVNVSGTALLKTGALSASKVLVTGSPLTMAQQDLYGVAEST